MSSGEPMAPGQFGLAIDEAGARRAVELLSRVLWRARWEAGKAAELEASRDKPGGQRAAPREGLHAPP